MAVQHQLVGFEASDDVLVRLGSVDADDSLFVAQASQLGFGFKCAGGVGDALDLTDIDGYGVDLHVGPVALPLHRKVMVVNLGFG